MDDVAITKLYRENIQNIFQSKVNEIYAKLGWQLWKEEVGERVGLRTKIDETDIQIASEAYICSSHILRLLLQ